MIQSKHTIAVPPGATIREQLADRDMSQKEFASRMGLSQKHISQLINGEVRLTPDVAVRLESVLGIPAQFWNNLEAIYQEKLIKAKEENDMDEDIELANTVPNTGGVVSWFTGDNDLETFGEELVPFSAVCSAAFFNTLRSKTTFLKSFLTTVSIAISSSLSK